MFIKTLPFSEIPLNKTAKQTELIEAKKKILSVKNNTIIINYVPFFLSQERILTNNIR